MEAGNTSQGIQKLLEARNGNAMDSPLEAPTGTQPRGHPDFSPG